MGDKLRNVSNVCGVWGMKDVVSLILLALALFGAYNSVLAQVDAKYAKRETAEYLEKRLDGVDMKLNLLLNHFSIKGIEGEKYGK
jgi:hypothetical protein